MDVTDLSWLQYIGNPYSVIAVIAAIAGNSFRTTIKKVEKPKPGFIALTYGMFLVAILALGFSVIAISFLLEGRGAVDSPITLENDGWRMENDHSQFSILNFQFASKALAQSETESGSLTGWLWAGHVTAVVPEEDTMMIESETIHGEEIEQSQERVVTKAKANLRDAPPKFSWWRLRYILGDLVTEIEPETELTVLGEKKAGKQLWLLVAADVEL